MAGFRKAEVVCLGLRSWHHWTSSDYTYDPSYTFEWDSQKDGPQFREARYPLPSGRIEIRDVPYNSREREMQDGPLESRVPRSSGAANEMPNSLRGKGLMTRNKVDPKIRRHGNADLLHGRHCTYGDKRNMYYIKSRVPPHSNLRSPTRTSVQQIIPGEFQPIRFVELI